MIGVTNANREKESPGIRIHLIVTNGRLFARIREAKGLEANFGCLSSPTTCFTSERTGENYWNAASESAFPIFTLILPEARLDGNDENYRAPKCTWNKFPERSNRFFLG